MSTARPDGESLESIFETAPCGYVATDPDGTILRVNRTFEELAGQDRAELVGRKRFGELLGVGARIYHETHCLPLLQVEGAISAIALELRHPDRSRVPVLVNAVLHRDEHGTPREIRTMVFDATERRRYERELLEARRREQAVAERLQRSLLLGDLPTAPGLDLGVAYRPADSGLDVGGDWYDAFWTDEGRAVGLVVGDVVGRGLDAAATMGQLRSAVRALASTGLAPGPLLEALDAFALRHEVGRMATVVYAELELESRTLRYTCAGHPPPAVLTPGEPAAFEWGGRSLPLAASSSGGRPRGTATLALAPAATLLLYTDGIIERRGESLDAGLDRLLEHASQRSGEPAATIADELVRVLHEPRHPDDVCLLVARAA